MTAKQAKRMSKAFNRIARLWNEGKADWAYRDGQSFAIVVFNRILGFDGIDAAITAVERL